ncbi:fam-a protein [Plasmodium vinckei brucechwatti]|uniref:Fam-a protein n=1 Tax=Plasmodium vinckei brucechwatti TaxID=119398 RepID=A0A6V7T2F2_PLAVN|nr:fam-a protein [Plasmodium vinckei brucechwatti]
MNKFYIQIVFFLLSIFIYTNNKTLETGLTPKKHNNKTLATNMASREKIDKTLVTNLVSREKIDKILATELTPREKCNKIIDAMLNPEEQNKRSREYFFSPEEHAIIDAHTRNEEIYKQNKDLLCTNPNETINAEKLMNEAVEQLEHHSTCKDGYEFHTWCPYTKTSLCEKKLEGNTILQKSNFQYYHPYKYNEIINLLWDPALANHFNKGSIKRKIVRVYSPNLVMIQQRYKNSAFGRWKYFYALAAKAQISEDATIIVMTSANINDGHTSKEEFKNKIIENANLFKTSINSEDDIRKGKLKKTFVNIAGYIVEKRDWRVDITYLESIDGHTSNFQNLILEKALNKFFNYEEDKLYVYT